RDSIWISVNVFDSVLFVNFHCRIYVTCAISDIFLTDFPCLAANTTYQRQLKMETENQNPFQLDVGNLFAFNPFHNFPSLLTSRFSPFVPS
ncbi:hypothetical protein E1A91_D02G108300v1, partial [Gossypium mustelinum]